VKQGGKEMSKVHRVKNNKTIIKRYRIIPYSELVPILKKDDLVFLEDDPNDRLKPGTVWKAAKRLSELVGKKIVASRVLYQVAEGSLEGYLFAVKAEGSPVP